MCLTNGHNVSCLAKWSLDWLWSIRNQPIDSLEHLSPGRKRYHRCLELRSPMEEHTKIDRILSVILLVSLLSVLVCAQPSQHDRGFWRAIAKNDYALPAGESADALSQEISGLLASPDPELRDDLAYSILARWIYRCNLLSTPTLLALTNTWRSNIAEGIGETGTHSVLKRSFSALCLSAMAERESKLPFMGRARYHNLVAQAVAYLQAERPARIRPHSALNPRNCSYRRPPRRQLPAKRSGGIRHNGRDRCSALHCCRRLNPG